MDAPAVFPWPGDGAILARMSPRSMVHELTITLLGVEPPVWRRVQVRSDATLSRVHGDIQAVMGWTNSHLHQFEIGDLRYGSPDPDDVPMFGDPVHDERKSKLGSLTQKRRSVHLRVRLR